MITVLLALLSKYIDITGAVNTVTLAAEAAVVMVMVVIFAWAIDWKRK